MGDLYRSTVHISANYMSTLLHRGEKVTLVRYLCCAPDPGLLGHGERVLYRREAEGWPGKAPPLPALQHLLPAPTARGTRRASVRRDYQTHRSSQVDIRAPASEITGL